MFLFKKILVSFLSPIPLSLLISWLGLFLLWCTKKQRAGKIFVSIGICIFALPSFDSISSTLLVSLERQYDAYKSSVENSMLEHQYLVKFVVVLGGGHISDPAIPITSQLSASSLVRLIEGVRIYRENPGSKLILSGGSVFDPISDAEVMMDIVKAIGIDEDDIIIESESRDTEDQAKFIKSMVGSNQFVLVTSASHMPRSMALFKKLGMKPIPAPTRHLAREKQESNPTLFFPNSGALGKSERAFYEYLGIVWLKLRGQI